MRGEVRMVSESRSLGFRQAGRLERETMAASDQSRAKGAIDEGEGVLGGEHSFPDDAARVGSVRGHA